MSTIVHTADIFLPIYCDVFNCILDSGYFPAQWTKGVIIPIYKNKGYNALPRKYRPNKLLKEKFYLVVKMKD